MQSQLRKNAHEYCKCSIRIMLLFFVIFIFFPVSCCLAESINSETTIEQDDPNNIEDLEEYKIEGKEKAIVSGEKKEMTEAQDKATMEIPKDEYHYNPFGKRDPFFSKLLVEKKKIEPNKKLFGVQRYDLAELKLVGIIWGGLGRKGVVETPEGKSYLVKVGTLIGKKGGVVKAITNQEVVIQELESDYLGNQIENISILSIQRKEQEQ